MDPSLPSPSRRHDASPQGEGEDLEKIASQMEWDDEYNANAVSEDEGVLELVKGLGQMAYGKIRLIHTLLNEDKGVQWRNLIQIMNRNLR